MERKKRRRKARLSRRQRTRYLSLLREIKKCKKEDRNQSMFPYDDWQYPKYVGHSIASVAYHWAKQWGCRKDVDIVKLQTAVCKFGNAKTIFLFAKNIPEANINKLQYEIIKRDDPYWIRMFAEHISNSKTEMLNRMANVAEIMEDLS